jgi:hypothetical protein
MTTTHKVTMDDLRVHDGLMVLTIHTPATEPKPELEGLPPSERPGAPEWFVENFGYDDDGGNDFPRETILAWKYSSVGPGEFQILIETRELGEFTRRISAAGLVFMNGYAVHYPQQFGDPTTAVVELLKHRDGWLVIPAGERLACQSPII